MQVDYIIVGLGLAGLAFSKELAKHNKSFVVFEDNSHNSSIVAGGMYNPVILKRFTPVWDAIDQLKVAIPFYEALEKEFNSKYHYSVDIYRVFKSIEEQNNWFIASDKPLLSEYMDAEIVHEKHIGIKADFGYGKLKNTGRIDTKLLLEDFRKYLSDKNLLKKESFKYTNLKIENNTILYNNIKASKIVFCEGFGLKQNPFFNYLPMQEAKGELLIIHAPNLNIDFLVKSAVFILPLGNNYYKVGATFNWKDTTNIPTEDGKKELLTKLKLCISVPFKVVDHIAGIRPTVKDRRPLIGKHSKYSNMAILNGLGTRGVMIAPKAAKLLYKHLEFGEALEEDFDIARFS